MPEVMIPYVGHFDGERITFSPHRLYAHVDCMPSDYADALNEAYRELVGQLTRGLSIFDRRTDANNRLLIDVYVAEHLSPECPLIVVVDYFGKPAWCEAYHIGKRLSDRIEPRDIGFVLNIE